MLLCALLLTMLAACGEQREGEQPYRAPEAGDYFYGRILLVITHLTCADEEEAKEALERLLQREDVQSAEFDRVISLID